MDKSGLVYRLEKTGFSYNDYATILESDIAPTDPVSYTFSYGGCQWRIQLAPREGWSVMNSFGAVAALGLAALLMLTALTYILLFMHDRQKGLYCAIRIRHSTQSSCTARTAAAAMRPA